jgi:hypothetical protein
MMMMMMVMVMIMMVVVVLATVPSLQLRSLYFKVVVVVDEIITTAVPVVERVQVVIEHLPAQAVAEQALNQRYLL